MWRSHITHMNVSCHTYECIMTHIRLSHVARTQTYMSTIYQQQHTYTLVMSHIWMRHVIHVNESCHIMNASCWTHTHTDDDNIPAATHIYMSHVAHMNASCHTCEWVMSHIWMRHVAHTQTRMTTIYQQQVSPLFWIQMSQERCVCCSVLQCVAVCCSVLQCVAACCSVLQYVAVCCSVLPCVAVCCSCGQGVLRFPFVLDTNVTGKVVVLQCQCVSVWCSVMQCVAVAEKVWVCNASSTYWTRMSQERYV